REGIASRAGVNRQGGYAADVADGRRVVRDVGRRQAVDRRVAHGHVAPGRVGRVVHDQRAQGVVVGNMDRPGDALDAAGVADGDGVVVVAGARGGHGGGDRRRADGDEIRQVARVDRDGGQERGLGGYHVRAGALDVRKSWTGAGAGNRDGGPVVGELVAARALVQHQGN